MSMPFYLGIPALVSVGALALGLLPRFFNKSPIANLPGPPAGSVLLGECRVCSVLHRRTYMFLLPKVTYPRSWTHAPLANSQQACATRMAQSIRSMVLSA